MKFGLFFDLALPKPWSATSEQTLFAQALDYIRLGEMLGIDYCWAAERNFLEELWHGSAPEVFLAAFSQNTRRMRIGYINQMDVAINHPARVSARLGTLDLLSHGRVDWGFGWPMATIETAALKVPPDEREGREFIGVQECAKMQCAEPYPGIDHSLFTMETRNVLPKPSQQPHPPLWRACANLREVGQAGAGGVGVLWIGDGDVAAVRLAVATFYATFKAKCEPLGRKVNPRFAVVTPFFCQPADQDQADVEAGLRFRAGAEAHFHRAVSRHQEGSSQAPEAQSAVGGRAAPACGSVEELKLYFGALEELGVDQVVLMHQLVGVAHEAAMASITRLGRDIIPDFQQRDGPSAAQKASLLAPFVEQAEARLIDLEMTEVPEVDSYPSLSKRLGIDMMTLQQGRAPLGAAMWRLQVGGPRRKKNTSTDTDDVHAR